MKTFDFRSDTVTKPSDAMREAMAKAVVGDDVYHEDPTVNRLEAMTAELLGKEASLFVSSGTMGNLVAVLAQCQRGDEVIMGTQGHTFLHEAGGVSVLGGVSMFTVPTMLMAVFRWRVLRLQCAIILTCMSLLASWLFSKIHKTSVVERC